MGDYILDLIEAGGYFAVFALMFLENVFPPIPSEVVLPLTGIAVAKGQLTLVGASMSALAGSVLGTFLWFLLGWYLSVDRIKTFLTKYGVYVAISVKDFEFTEKIFRKYSAPSVLLCRLVPTLRSVISLPAGSIRMSFKLFLALTVVGTFFWNSLLISVGMGFEAFMGVIEHYLNPAVNIIIGFFVLLYLVQIVRFWFFTNRQSSDGV